MFKANYRFFLKVCFLPKRYGSILWNPKRGAVAPQSPVIDRGAGLAARAPPRLRLVKDLLRRISQRQATFGGVRRSIGLKGGSEGSG